MASVETDSPDDRDPDIVAVSPVPLMSREEFERRFKAIQREESRYALIMLLIFFLVLLALCFFTFSNNGQVQFQTATLIGLFVVLIANLIVPIWLAMAYFDRRPQRFGFICPNCDKPLRGFLVFRTFKYAECPSCKSWLAVE